jgi:hypothetical protein
MSLSRQVLSKVNSISKGNWKRILDGRTIPLVWDILTSGPEAD